MKKLTKGILFTSLVTSLCATSFFLGKNYKSDNKKEKDEILVLAQEDNDEEEGIVSHTLAITDTIYLGYYVLDNNIKEGEELKVYVWEDETDANNHETPDFVCDYYSTVSGESGTQYQLFLLKGLGYKNLVDIYYASAVRVSDGEVTYYSDIDDYSMLDYCCNHYDDTRGYTQYSTYTLGSFILGLVDYATNCQKYFEYRTDYLAIDNYNIPRYAFATVKSGDQKLFVARNLNEALSFIDSDKLSAYTNVRFDFEEAFDYEMSLDIKGKCGDQITFNFKEGTHIKDIKIIGGLSGSCSQLCTFKNASIDTIMALSDTSIQFNNCKINDTINCSGPFSNNQDYNFVDCDVSASIIGLNDCRYVTITNSKFVGSSLNPIILTLNNSKGFSAVNSNTFENFTLVLVYTPETAVKIIMNGTIGANVNLDISSLSDLTNVDYTGLSEGINVITKS